MRPLLITTLSFFVGIFNVQATDVLVETRPLDHVELTQYNVDYDQYTHYQQEFTDSIIAFFSRLKTGYDVKIFQTLDPNLYPYYSFAAKPALTDSLRHALQKKLMSVKPITTKYLPFSTAFTIQANGGCEKRGLDYSPILENPLEARLRPYTVLDLGTRKRLIENWLIKGALPVMEDLLNTNRVRINEAFGIADLNIDSVRANGEKWDLKLLNASPHFSADPQLIPTLKVMLLSAAGNFDHAQRYMQMIYQFEPPTTLLHYLLDELYARMSYYFAEERRLMAESEGMDWEAKQHFLDSLTGLNPNSNAFLYGRLDKLKNASILAYSPHEVAVRTRFLTTDPMRTAVLNPQSKKEAYHNAIRTEMDSYFVDPETFNTDFERYAEAALKLESYAFAADLYGMLACAAVENGTEKDQPDYALRYRYALSKINPDLTKINPADKKNFNRIDKKLKREMKKNSSYKTFKNSEE